jgi:hypothetical protein
MGTIFSSSESKESRPKAERKQSPPEIIPKKDFATSLQEILQESATLQYQANALIKRVEEELLA